MKKILVSLLLIFAMCFSMAACDLIGGNQGENPGVNPDTPAPEKVLYQNVEAYNGGEVTITFSHTMNEQLRNTLDSAIKRFNEIYPNITVEHAQIGGYDEVRDQIKTELTAGNQPNIAYCYPDHVALYNITKKVVPLDAFIESELSDGNGGILGLTEAQKQDLIEGGFYYEGTVFDAAGTMYTLPFSKSTEVLYYNKEIFDKHAAEGLKVPTTWEEMEAACKFLKEKYPDSIPLGYDSESNWFITMTEQYGSPYTSNVKGEYFLFNNAKNREFVEMFRGWYDKGYVTTKELYGGYTSALFTELTKSERAFMCIGSTGGAKNQVPTAIDGGETFTVAIAPIPQVDPDNGKAISQGPSLCIFDQDNKQEVAASWLFVKFITTDARLQAEVSMLQGYMPVIASVMDLDVYSNYINNANGTTQQGVTALAVKESIATNKPAGYYFVSPAFNGSSEARDQVGSLMQYCFVTQTTDIKQMISDAFKAAIEECETNT